MRPCRRCDVWTDSTERNDTCRPIVCDSVGIDGAAARIRAVLRPHGARHEHLCSCAAWFLTEEIPFLTEEMSSQDTTQVFHGFCLAATVRTDVRVCHTFARTLLV